MAEGYDIMKDIDINQQSSEFNKPEVTILEDGISNTLNPSSISIGSTRAKVRLTIGDTCGSTTSNKDNATKIGRYIGTSRKGCALFTGMNIDTGKLLYITEWNIKYSRIEATCTSSCFWSGKLKCRGHDIDDFINSIERHVKELSQLEHKNLVSYDSVICLKQEEGLLIRLAQDFVQGNNLVKITNTTGWNADGVRNVAKAVSEAIQFLHMNGIIHGYINDRSVFLDNSGQIKCSDFALVTNLIGLVSDRKQNDPDLPALGNVIENLMSTLPDDIKTFVDKCKLDRTLSAYQLLNYPFVQGNNDVAPVYKPTYHSRIKADFEILGRLAKGAFGVVLKIRKFLDKREYAIKKIPVPEDEKEYQKMETEIMLLHDLEHCNIVRYFNSWIENATPEDYYDFVEENCANQSVHSNTTGSTDSYLPFSRIMYIQMEFCEMSTMRKAIDENLYANTDKVWEWFNQILEGLKYIHSKKVIHRDLKPANIFINSNQEVKIGDFGLSTVINSASPSQDNANSSSSTFYVVGTPLYMAPELGTANFNSVYTEKIDMYALGIIFFEMCNPPFTKKEEQIEKIEDLRLKHTSGPIDKLLDRCFEDKTLKIIQWLLHHNPDQRPSAEKLLKRLNIEYEGVIQKHIDGLEHIIAQVPKLHEYVTRKENQIRTTDRVTSLLWGLKEKLEKN